MYNFARLCFVAFAPILFTTALHAQSGGAEFGIDTYNQTSTSDTSFEKPGMDGKYKLQKARKEFTLHSRSKVKNSPVLTAMLAKKTKHEAWKALAAPNTTDLVAEHLRDLANALIAETGKNDANGKEICFDIMLTAGVFPPSTDPELAIDIYIRFPLQTADSLAQFEPSDRKIYPGAIRKLKASHVAKLQDKGVKDALNNIIELLATPK